MLVKGIYNEAKIFTEVIDDGAIEQIKKLCDIEAFKDSVIRIMPDVHSGAGCTIGTSMTIKDKVNPELVGVDIGCGMFLIKLEESETDLEELDRAIKNNVPSGREVRALPLPEAEETYLESLKCKEAINLERAKLSVGTLGGGNHFIELDEDEEKNKYLVIHSGSRRLGKEIADYYTKHALAVASKQEVNDLIRRMKSEGREREIESTIKEFKNKERADAEEITILEGRLFDEYIHDMKIAQRFADINRRAIADCIMKAMNLHAEYSFCTVHNYIDADEMILRKGAVSAKAGERLIIPINMRDGSLICTGKGNPDWNYSAPHGAGRLMSRAKAAAMLSLEEFKRQMTGIYSTCISQSTLDESPMAYKRLEDIADNVTPTVKIEKRIYPVYNFKAQD